jgi:hypothetical protein
MGKEGYESQSRRSILADLDQTGRTQSGKEYKEYGTCYAQEYAYADPGKQGLP